MIDVVASMFLHLYILTAHNCRTLYIHYCTHSACEVWAVMNRIVSSTPILHNRNPVWNNECIQGTPWIAGGWMADWQALTRLVHRPATQQPLTSLSTHTHRAILYQYRNRRPGNAPPHTLSGSANHHFSDSAYRNHDITLHHTSAEPEHHVSNKGNNT